MMVATHPAIAELCRVVGEDGVRDDPNELHVYQCDGFSVARGLPTAVVFPRNTQQVADCIRIANQHDLMIVPRGSGTGLAGGATAFGGGLIICTSRMTVIETIDVANRYAVVQAGVYNTALSAAVRAVPGGACLHFSPDPSSQAASTIAGNAATNAGGINTLKHGVTRNHILGMEMVLADGSILHTRTQGLCDGVGGDLPGFLCGSEGTLGLVTRVWCRLVPRPRAFRTIYAVFDSTFNACKTVSDIVATGIIPTSMEMMDGAMIGVVEDAFHYGFPRHARALLLIEIDGIEAVLDEQLERVVQACRDNEAFDMRHCSDPKKRAELWSARKRAFGAIGRISHSYCTQDACIPRSKLPEAVDHIHALGRKYGMTITNVFHAGDGNVHPIMLFDDNDPQQVQRTMHLSEEILAYCIDIGGVITGEHGVGVEKLHLMHRMFDATSLQTLQKLKRVFDPDGVLNEGKLIPSDRVRIDLIRPDAPVAANIPGGAL